MAQLDVTPEEIKALGMVNIAFEKAIFPMIEGSEVQNLASSRARLTSLRFKLDKYLKEIDEETAQKMSAKLKKQEASKPIKKDK